MLYRLFIESSLELLYFYRCVDIPYVFLFQYKGEIKHLVAVMELTKEFK